MENAFCYGFQKEYSIIKETLNLECDMEPNHPRHQKRPNGHHPWYWHWLVFFPIFRCIFEMLLTFVESAKLLSWMIIGFAFQNFERQKEINNLARGLQAISNITCSYCAVFNPKPDSILHVFNSKARFIDISYLFIVVFSSKKIACIPPPPFVSLK